MEEAIIKQFKNLSAYKGNNHFISTRHGGVSEEHYSSLNLGFKSGDQFPYIRKNREILCRTIGIPEERFINPIQTHSRNVAIIRTLDDLKKEYSDTDGFITRLKDVCIAVLLADCVPVVLYDPVEEVAAVVHSGWRGTVKKVGSGAVRIMMTEFGCNPANILAGIGPSISVDHFEVGPEVVYEFEKVFPEVKNKLINTAFVKPHIDLWKANEYVLTEAGIPVENIETMGYCTWNNNEDFYSYRKEKGVTGRFAAGIILTS